MAIEVMSSKVLDAVKQKLDEGMPEKEIRHILRYSKRLDLTENQIDRYISVAKAKVTVDATPKISYDANASVEFIRWKKFQFWKEK